MPDQTPNTPTHNESLAATVQGGGIGAAIATPIVLLLSNMVPLEDQSVWPAVGILLATAINIMWGWYLKSSHAEK